MIDQTNSRLITAAEATELKKTGRLMCPNGCNQATFDLTKNGKGKPSLKPELWCRECHFSIRLYEV